MPTERDSLLPRDLEASSGALRAGAPLRLGSLASLGLLAQFAAVGFLNGVLPNVIYPVLQGYLNAEGTTIVSATLLVQLPWSFKVFFGILSDSLPIQGFRRRPYMVLGWLFCIMMLVYMAFLDVPAPYYGDASMHFTSPDAWTDVQRKTINTHAPDAATQYVIPMMLAACGFLVVETTADAIVVEYAQREPLDSRGQLQAAIHCMRMTFNALGGLTVALAFNGVQYGGDFTFAISLPQLMSALVFVYVPLLPLTWLGVRETRVHSTERRTFSKYIESFWLTLQQRAVYQIAAYKFFSGVLNNLNIVSSSNIKFYWVHATPFNSSMMTIVGTLVYAATLALTGVYGRHWNWHVSITLTVVIGILLDGLMTMVTTWDIVRNQWLWLGVPVVGYIPEGVRFLVANYVVVELISEGHEGALYGLLTTTANLASPFGRTTSKLINAQFQVWRDDIIRDTYEVRRDVTITIWICYSCKLLSLLMLPLLPSQKDTAQRLKQHGGTSRLFGIVTVVYLSVALVWSVGVNLLSLFPSTRCWPIAGGCKE
ncbi:hypothetical protein Poli38472_014283 [Pythium oligandrum]|uniref:Folate-Biopterin Transporter (FBT) Family n=1 Tax=Pythium oligandrum TaxID=41045 RepID=A0A8K1CK34_PYTOL|nr:hypothetical protein Poli38472_014283 [Pythium oligandrum]|eukprot:TMW64166.1 hypothetical protein Poli38472_014283 [Pythium oligandrum]